MKNYISLNNLKKNVHLLGYVSHGLKLIKLLHQHQYFILPSIVDFQGVHDVHPNVIKEAMSAGLLCITSRLGGIDEIIVNGKNAFLINKPTPKNIAKMIDYVQSLPLSQKKSLSLHARQTILKQHLQENICSQLKDIFSKYTNEKK